MSPKSPAKGTGRGGARPGSGPKPRPVEEHRRNRIMLNLTDAELRALAEAAGSRPITGFARDLMLRALARRRARPGDDGRERR